MTYLKNGDTYDFGNSNKFSNIQVPIKDHRELTFWQKIIYTMIHNYIHLVFGLTLSSMAPAFVDYREILHTEMQWIGLFPMFQAIGIFTGSFVTIIFKYVNRQITLSILIVLQGLGTIFQPWSTSLWHLYGCIFIYGVSVGAWNGSNNVILIEMWQNRSPSILQFSQFIYGMGTVLGPLLDRNFVLGEQICPGVYPEDCLSHFNSTDALNMTTDDVIMFRNHWHKFRTVDTENAGIHENLCTPECLAYDRRPRLKMPLLIGGLLQMLGPAMYMIMYFLKPYKKSNDSNIEVIETEAQKQRYKEFVPKRTIIICVSLYLAFGIMSENMYMDFAPTFYQFCPLRLSANDASEMFSYVGMALTFGRGISVFIALYLKPQHMIAYQSVIVFVGYIFQYFSQHDYKLLLASSVVICFGYSSIFICLYSFVGQYTEVTDRIGGLFIGSYNAIYMFLPYFIAKYVEVVPDSFVFVEFISMCLAIISFIYVMWSVRNVPEDLIRKLGPIGGH